MKRLALLLSSALLLMLSACSSLPSPESDWDENYDFSHIKTYSFIDREKLRNMTPLTNDITRNRVESAIEKKMATQGIAYEKDMAKADVLVSYHITTKDKQDIQTYNVGVSHIGGYRGYGGYGMGVGYSTTDVRVKDYVEGTLIIDMLKPTDQKAIWRGQLSAKISDLKEQQERIDAINYAVDSIIGLFPPVSAAAPEKAE